MIHPDTELRFVSHEIGLGVFAKAPIPRGTLTYVPDELEIRVTPQRFKALPELLQEHVERYSYIDAHGVRVMSWDLAKYTNHACDPNTLSTGWGFEIALRDIAPGEEITDDYGLFNVPAPIRVACPNCAECRGFVRADDPLRLGDIWDHRVQTALDFVRAVDQPLWPVMDARTARDFEAFLDGRGPYRSVSLLMRPIPPPRAVFAHDAATALDDV